MLFASKADVFRWIHSAIYADRWLVVPLPGSALLLSKIPDTTDRQFSNTDASQSGQAFLSIRIPISQTGTTRHNGESFPIDHQAHFARF